MEREIIASKGYFKEFFNVSALIDERFGKEGTVTRAEAEEKAYATPFTQGRLSETRGKRLKSLRLN
jgi:hypothetical protein